MKKILCSLLALIMILCMVCSCGSKEEVSDTAAVAETEKTALIDYSDPIVEAQSEEYRNIYEADGLAHDNTYVIPHLNVDLENANKINDEIDQFFTDNYGIHFSMMDDLSGEKVPAGEEYINIMYSYTIDMDVVSIVLQCEQCCPPDLPTTTYKVFHWDALADIELDAGVYMEYEGISESSIATALSTINMTLTEDSSGVQLNDIVAGDEGCYYVYLTYPDSTMTVVSLALDKETAPTVPNS